MQLRESDERFAQALADYVVLFKRTSGAVKEARKGQEWLASLQEKLDRLRLACKNVRDIIESFEASGRGGASSSRRRLGRGDRMN